MVGAADARQGCCLWPLVSSPLFPVPLLSSFCRRLFAMATKKTKREGVDRCSDKTDRVSGCIVYVYD